MHLTRFDLEQTTERNRFESWHEWKADHQLINFFPTLHESPTAFFQYRLAKKKSKKGGKWREYNRNLDEHVDQNMLPSDEI